MLSKLITSRSLKGLAGATVFSRGEEYFSGGAVDRLRDNEGKVTARVTGTARYQVELWENEDDELAYDCTCPHASDGYFCKHCVAVGLAWLASDVVEGAPAKSSSKKKPDLLRDIETYLRAQAPQSLINLLLEVAQRDDQLYRSLLLHAGRTGGRDVTVAFRRAIDDVTQIHGFVDWREAATFAANVHSVVDSMTELLQSDAAALIELAEYAIQRVEEALGEIDDSDGEMGGVVCRLGEIHLEACTMARPEPAALAERLFELQTASPYGFCSFSAATYSEPLGKVGLRRYRELAQAEWNVIQPSKSGDPYDARRECITRMMEQFAQISGDVDELVAIKARDLSSSFRYLEIAEICAKARQHDKALEWAERGVQAFAERTDNRLRDFLVAAYVKRKRWGEAVQLTWIQFEERPGLEQYQKLSGVALKAGVWTAQRERALSLIAAVTAREATATTRWKPHGSKPDHTLRVRIALWEADLDTAWTMAHEGICDRDTLITLAGKLEPTRATDAINLYRRIVPSIIERAHNAAYEEAVALVRKVGRLSKAQGETREFSDYLTQLRVQFKPKRNFIKLLDEVVRIYSKN